jgi:phospholipase D-like protein
MYTFNEPTLSDALIRAKGRGVVLRVIIDTTQAHLTNSQADALIAAGIPVRLMKGTKGHGIMHHKIAIYDRAVVQTGSFLTEADTLKLHASILTWAGAAWIKPIPRFRTRRTQSLLRSLLSLP